jgi:hypothetical protein
MLIRLASIILLLVLYIAFTIAFCVRLWAWEESEPGHCYNTSRISHPGDKHPDVDYVYVALTCFFLVVVLAWALTGAFDYDPNRVQVKVRVRTYFSFSSPSVPIVVQAFSPPQLSEDGSSRISASFTVLTYALLQLPLHLYSVIALRVTNLSLLERDSENAWGFGQVVALVMVLATLSECGKGFKGQ